MQEWRRFHVLNITRAPTQLLRINMSPLESTNTSTQCKQRTGTAIPRSRSTEDNQIVKSHPLVSLYPDILRCIVDSSANNFYRSTRFNALKALSLVSKACRTTAQSYLLSSIGICPESETRSLPVFADFLALHPDIMPMIRELHVSGRSNFPDSKNVVRVDDFRVIVPKLRNLCALHFSSTTLGVGSTKSNEKVSMLTASHPIRVLSLSNVYIHCFNEASGPFADLLGMFSSVNMLCTSSSMFVRVYSDTPLQRGKRAHVHSVDIAYATTNHARHIMAYVDPSNLHTLCLEEDSAYTEDRADQYQHCIRVASRLKELVVRIPDRTFTSFHSQDLNAQSLLKTEDLPLAERDLLLELGTCESLETLKLIFHVSGPSDSTLDNIWDQAIALVLSLPLNCPIIRLQLRLIVDTDRLFCFQDHAPPSLDYNWAAFVQSLKHFERLFVVDIEIDKPWCHDPSEMPPHAAEVIEFFTRDADKLFPGKHGRTVNVDFYEP